MDNFARGWTAISLNQNSINNKLPKKTGFCLKTIYKIDKMDAKTVCKNGEGRKKAYTDSDANRIIKLAVENQDGSARSIALNLLITVIKKFKAIDLADASRFSIANRHGHRLGPIRLEFD